MGTNQPSLYSSILRTSINLDKLPPNIAAPIKAFQQSNPASNQKHELQVREAIEMWLYWHGIYGYTEMLLEAVLACWLLGANNFKHADNVRGVMRHG